LCRDSLEEDYEALDGIADSGTNSSFPEEISEVTRTAIEKEIADLEGFAALASSIQHNAKGRALLKAKLHQGVKRLSILRERRGLAGTINGY
jgi:hypothetical protein